MVLKLFLRLVMRPVVLPDSKLRLKLTQFHALPVVERKRSLRFFRLVMEPVVLPDSKLHLKLTQFHMLPVMERTTTFFYDFLSHVINVEGVIRAKLITFFFQTRFSSYILLERCKNWLLQVLHICIWVPLASTYSYAQHSKKLRLKNLEHMGKLSHKPNIGDVHQQFNIYTILSEVHLIFCYTIDSALDKLVYSFCNSRWASLEGLDQLKSYVCVCICVYIYISVCLCVKTRFVHHICDTQRHSVMHITNFG